MTDKKKRYTTYPIGPLSYSRTVQAIAEALASVMDPALKQNRSQWQWESYLHYGVAPFWLGRTVDLSLTELAAEAADLWKQVGLQDTGVVPAFDGTFTLSKNLARAAVYSISSVAYPQLMASIRLPHLRLLGNETAMHYYLGLENGASYFNGLYCFVLIKSATLDNVLRAVVGTLDVAVFVTIDVKKPADATTAYHNYNILMSKNLVQYRIDGYPALFAVPCGVSAPVIVKQNVQPYSLVLVKSAPAKITPFFELWTNRTLTLPATEDFVAPISPYRFRYSEGYEITPLSLPLYVEDTATLFRGSVVAAGSLTSHPFPTFGYSSTTLLFRANGAGTLSIQVLTQTNNWREYDTVPITANTLASYILEGDAVLDRVVFTPTTPPATITDAEVTMIGGGA